MSQTFQGCPKSWPDVTGLASSSLQSDMTWIVSPLKSGFLGPSRKSVFPAKRSTFALYMLYILWILGMLAFKWAIVDQCQCILLCVRILLANLTPFSTTSETLSYTICPLVLTTDQDIHDPKISTEICQNILNMHIHQMRTYTICVKKV